MARFLRHFVALSTILALVSLYSPVHAGLYYSGESYAELPAQWRGFLLDQRTLRNIAVRETAKTAASPARVRYLEEAARLEKLATQRPLSAEEIADLVALYIRLGKVPDALVVLEPAARRHANHFQLLANLGTAYQLAGELPRAHEYLRQAARLAPGKFLAAEELHVKLVRERMLRRDSKNPALDDLFGIRFVNDMGDYEPGKIAAAEKKKLPARAVASVQQLALWLPADPQLLWQLAELASAHGDAKNAAAMMDGCLTQFGLNHPDLRKHRQLMRAAADALPKAPLVAKEPHEEKHAGTLAFRSKRPLLSKLDATPLPPISDSGINVLPWDVFNETAMDAKFRPSFPRYLQELAGKQVSLSGFMQPLRDETDMPSFLFIEYPVGCWYCEMPETTGIVFVELAAGKSATYQRGLVRVIGRLALNSNDPEDFLYALRDARITGVD